MSNVTFMDSTGLHVIVHAAKSMPSGCIVLHGVNPTVAKLLEQTGVTRHPRIHAVPCREDPFPEGGAMRDHGTSNDVYQQMLAMKAKHKELVDKTQLLSKLEIRRGRRWSELVRTSTAKTRAAHEGHRANVAARRAWIEAIHDRLAA